MSPSAIAAGTLEIWTTWLDKAPAATPACLSDDERARAARIVSACARDRFLRGRAFLRHVLGRATGRGAGEIRFRYGPYGKPSIEGGTVYLLQSRPVTTL